VAIPITLLDPPPNTFSYIMQWATRLFWTCDIPASFFTGLLLPNGSVELSLRKIARNYVLSWFALDVTLVLLDWVEGLIGSDSAGYGRATRAGRTVRTLRMVRLLRLVRMKEILKLITSRIRSERLTVTLDIIKIMTAITSLAHFIACLWYGLGQNAAGKANWVDALDLQSESLEYRYLFALHWSLSQFNGGMDEVKAQNFEERVFNVSVFLIAWMLAICFVSGLTSEMTRLHILSSHQSRQLSILQRFLNQSRISDALALRVQRNAKHAISEKQRLMPENDVELLRMVSEPLLLELHFEMYMPVLELHPFFSQYVNACPQVMRKVCHQAMSTLLISAGDVVFNAGEMPANPQMYIICTGVLEYIPMKGKVAQVEAEQWLSEAVLWTPWVHRGVLQAKSDGRLCMLDARKFQEIVGQFDHSNSHFDPKMYAAGYVKYLNKIVTRGEEISDTMQPVEEAIMKSTFLGGTFRDQARRRRSAFIDGSKRQQGNLRTKTLTMSGSSLSLKSGR